MTTYGRIELNRTDGTRLVLVSQRDTVRTFEATPGGGSRSSHTFRAPVLEDIGNVILKAAESKRFWRYDDIGSRGHRKRVLALRELGAAYVTAAVAATRG